MIGAPGYAKPNTIPTDGFDIRFGRRSSDRRRIEWTPCGSYKAASFSWDWKDPAAFSIDLKPDHRLVPYMTGLRRKAVHVQMTHNGIPFTGRVMTRKVAGKPGRETVTLSGFDNKFQLKRALAWVNPLFPPELQIGLTGKQDIMAGEPDFVLKYFLAKNMIRLHKPIYAALPLHQVTNDLPDLADVNSLDDLLGLVTDSLAQMCVVSARFTPLDELFKLTRDRLDFGYRMDLWDGYGDRPQVFNTSGLSQLQSVIDATSDNFLNFLNPNNYLGLTDPGSWGQMDRAGYIFDTRAKRDMRHIQWRTDGGQIENYELEETHADATRAIVGGRAPEILNQVIEWAANFAIQLLITAIAPGLGLGFVVGDLFDDIFFAYQQFFDEDLEDDIGIDDAFGEVFADNTAAWSLDSYAVGKGALKDHSGSEALRLTVDTGNPDGYRFGALDGSNKRYDVGDIHTVYDRGTTAEQFVSAVTISDERDGRMVEVPTLGEPKRLGGPWERAISGLQNFGQLSRGLANNR
ncbi:MULTISPECIES: hypothetical protein [unclassified Rhodococcus (in: high G+C Gram-positive bacteria)]|uniref:Gp37-like protein n=1 Tax=unclassified Rhodococcus (in: high G+C Gram-positive bacteria) TaxID=192944 RepID=UPI000700085D|nr:MULTISPECIES: hypothetical protein [unclassified Rhodococcus (in: high G+C Gram-positive bacteria)]KQU30348.1 hypothetical protein ASG69_04640 [Rhodococcus sp. Leaf225]KQU44747.1 hypothetical protein ASH03_12500 [Rhodococcus sp. Leaf258]